MKWIIDLYRKILKDADLDWRHVPPPNWAAKRGWRDYW